METKKYIIEIPDNTAWLQWVKVSDKDGHVCFDFKYPEDLTLYTEPDLDAVRKEAYDKGYQDAAVKIGSDEQKIAEKAYQRGLNDAWDAARKIESLSACEFDKVFTGYDDCFKVFENYTPQETIEKIRQYGQEKTKEAIPHRNYQYMSDYWCECGWHLGKRGAVKFCADCGRRIKWD